MAKYMIMGKYSSTAMKAILEDGSDREAAARGVVEAAGGKLLGFYGMMGQEYNVALIMEVPGPAEYIGALAPAITAGVLESWKTIPLMDAADIVKGGQIARKAAEGYDAPGS
jgi:uncharacterized protein with GYD domain